MTGAIHQRQPGSAECPHCHRHNLRELKLSHDYHCRNCNRQIPLAEIVWRRPKSKGKGSGVIAGPVHVRGYANWGGGRA